MFHNYIVKFLIQGNGMKFDARANTKVPLHGFHFHREKNIEAFNSFCFRNEIILNFYFQFRNEILLLYFEPVRKCLISIFPFNA